MKKIYAKVVSIFLVIILVSCKSDEPTSPYVNPFAGKWTVFFDGSYSGSDIATVDDKGNFSLTVTLTKGEISAQNTIKGSMSNDGKLSGEIIFTATGNKVGTVQGQFNGDAGSGTYQTIEPSSGTWIAQKRP